MDSQKLCLSRVQKHLEAVGRDYPNAWKQVDMFRKTRGKTLPEWPNWCFLPMGGWYAIVGGGLHVERQRIPHIGRLAAIGAWRYSQGIYRFDDSVYQSLRESVPSGDIPLDVLLRLPEWSVYIETPKAEWLGDPLHGFWVHLEHDINSGRPELRFLFDTEASLVPFPLHVGKWTFVEAVERAIDETLFQTKLTSIYSSAAKKAKASELTKELNGFISLVLYLCSDEPEIDDERIPGHSPTIPQPKRTKGIWKLFPAKRARIWNVGTTLGKQLRESNQKRDMASTERGSRRRIYEGHIGMGSGVDRETVTENLTTNGFRQR